MRYQITVIILGIVVALFPLLHLPVAWEALIHVCIAIALVSTGIIIHQHRNRQSSHTTTTSKKSSDASPTEVTATPEKYAMPKTTSLESYSSAEVPPQELSHLIDTQVSSSPESLPKTRRRVIRS